jgi:NAD(P) transhydrogenase subunit alpha
VLVMGLGVAGLEAIATAHRLGAVVEGYDVRPETEEQALSLGATFVETGVDARGKGGYARELTAEEKTKVAAVLTKHIQAGRPHHHDGRHSRPAVAEAHQQGAGRRHEGRRRDRRSLRRRRRQLRGHAPGETAQVGQVTIVAPLNVPSLLGEDASELYAKNQYNLLALMMKDNIITIDWTTRFSPRPCSPMPASCKRSGPSKKPVSQPSR